MSPPIAADAALRGCPVDVYSLEMSSQELALRILADRLGVGSDKLRRGQITMDQHDDLVRAAKGGNQR